MKVNISMTDIAVAAELGRRLRSLRLNRNYSQQEIAELTGLSVTAVQSAEKGESKMITYIKILRVLGSLQALENFLPVVDISPLQLARMEGKKRQRASGKRKDQSR